MKRTIAVWSLLALAVPVLRAQQFIVDPANGPGTNFTTLDAAIAAVPSGSTLIVRAATYPKFVIDGKALTILADPGAQVHTVLDWYMTIKNTAANQPVYVRGMRPSWPESAFQVLDAAGLVCVDCQDSVMSMSAIPIYQSVTVTNCAQVHVKACSVAMNSATSITSSQVVFEDCEFRGNDKAWYSPTGFVPPSPALSLTNSRVQLVRCTGQGGLGDAVHPSRPALVLDAASELRLLGSGSYVGGGGTAAISGAGAVRCDPAVALSPGGPSPTIAPMPSMSSVDGVSGSTATAHCYVTTNDVFVVLFGLPGPPVDVPGVVGPVWFDLQAFVGYVAAVGPYPAGLMVQLSLPSAVVPTGLHFVWHTVVLSPTGLELSSPALSVVL